MILILFKTELVQLVKDVPQRAHNGIKEKKVITLNFIRRKMDEYERLEREIGKARQEIEEEVA
jgi:hypothetical protein